MILVSNGMFSGARNSFLESKSAQTPQHIQYSRQLPIQPSDPRISYNLKSKPHTAMILVSSGMFSGARNSFLASKSVQAPQVIKYSRWLPGWPPRWLPDPSISNYSKTKAPRIMILVSNGMFSRARNSFLASKSA